MNLLQKVSGLQEGSFRTAAGTAIFLASRSPRRIGMLKNLGLDFFIADLDANEPKPLKGESCRNFVERIARHKCLAASQKIILPGCQTRVFIAADTAVCLNAHILGKPENRQNAFEILCLLNGQVHEVHTGVSILIFKGSSEQEYSFSETTRVEFDHWPEDTLEAYAYGPEPADKAGAYAIQGYGSFLIEKIEGSWTNVVGLPLNSLVNRLVSSHLIHSCTITDTVYD